jgi:predicted transcriptional regulator
VPIKEDFQRLISEGVETVGIETMESIKNRIRERIVQQEQGNNGNGYHRPAGGN